MVLVALFAARLAAQDVLISEFQARNNTTISDKDGMFPDWFELYNAEPVPVDLSGWFATDDPRDLRQWRFPAVTIQPGGFLLVFASGKDIRDAGAELHTNFRLASDGEYLALVMPDGETVVWEYGTPKPDLQPDDPDPIAQPYPPQPADWSYGIPMGGVFFKFVRSGDPAYALVPTDDALGTSWRDWDFDDAGWKSGTTGVGYERSSGYEGQIGLNVGEMYGANASAYIRIPFTVDDASVITGLKFRIMYDDGFAAFLNGTPIASRHAPAALAWNSGATQDHADSLALVFESIAVPGAEASLRTGDNVLAIHGLNRGTTSSDFLIVPELEGFGADTGEIDRDRVHYFDIPTPGAPNVAGTSRLAERPTIEPRGGVFQGGSLTITMGVEAPDTEIRYTTDGTMPTAGSTLYTGPFSISASTLVRARGFGSGLGPSPTRSVGYIGLASDVRTFTSNLPVVLIENFNGGRPPTDPKRPAFMAIFEPPRDNETGEIIGRTSLAELPELETRIGIEIRGSSTAGRDKASYGIDGWDEDDDEKRIKVIGMPEHSDWVLYGAYNFDLALMRNHLIYQLSNDCGRYATRARFCEVFFNMDGGALSYADYRGVYSFMEKISRGEKRVDVPRLAGDVTDEPEITGGYMMKIDRGSARWNTQRQGSIVPVYPRAWNVTAAQNAWIRNYLQAFENALFGPNPWDPVLGYKPYVDVDSWVDHLILNAFPMNVDAIRLSGYFFKSRARRNAHGELEGGRIAYGPIWDFDRSMGSTDSRDDNWAAWHGTGDSSKYWEYDARYPWWYELFKDPDVKQRWVDRWFMFRDDPLSSAHISATIDAFREELSEAAVRNYQKWPLISPSQYPNQVAVLKNWLLNRANWIDSQFVARPAFSSPGGLITPGFTLSISGGATLYYTLDGSDPRGAGGAIAGTPYTGPITLDENTRVTARVRAASGPTSISHWSAPATEVYVVTPTPLVITEIMYHPPEGPAGSPYEDDDYEFIELLNRGDVPVDLSGVRMSDGVDFTFTEGTVLAAGSYAVLVRHLDAFKSRYTNWRDITILGAYAGALENSGERLAIEGVLGETIVEVSYDRLWYPVTDGDGYSLSVIDAYDPRDPWNDKRSWAPSAQVLGTPGMENSASPGGWQRQGDINQDGRFDLSDIVGYLRALFAGGTPLPCDAPALDAGGNLVLLDLNDDSRVDLADAVYGLTFLFGQGPAPVLGTACVLIEDCPHRCGF